MSATVVLLGASDGARLAGELRGRGRSVVAPDASGAGAGFVAATARALADLVPEPPLVLVAWGGAGALVPSVALSQRAAHRPVTGYVFVDAVLPSRTPHDHMPGQLAQPSDWPDAPCAYVRTPDGDAETARYLREAELRAWPTAVPDSTAALAGVLGELLGSW